MIHETFKAKERKEFLKYVGAERKKNKKEYKRKEKYRTY